MCILPDTEPPFDDASLIEFVARRARQVQRTKMYAYGALTLGLKGEQLSEIGLISEAGAVAFTDGTQAIGDAQVMRRALSYARPFGKAVVQHPEEPSLAQGGCVTEGEIATRLGLPAISPMAEIIMIERDLRLVEITQGRLHIAHVSTAAGVEAIRRAKARGLPVTADTAPPYFALNEIAIGDYRTFAKVSPPLRSEVDRQAIIEGIKDGTIDAIASDHAPHDQDSKRLPFAQAASGMIGLETLLPISLELVHNGYLDLRTLLRRLTITPAEILGLPGGSLSKGAAADLTVFDPERPWQIREKEFRSKSKNSAFDGRPVQGRALRTLVDGATAFAFDAAK